MEKRRRWRKRRIKMAKFFASKESRLARSGNGLAAGYGTLLPSYWYANVHLFPRVLEKDGHLLPPFLSLSLSLSIFFLRSIRQRLPAIFERDNFQRKRSFQCDGIFEKRKCWICKLLLDSTKITYFFIIEDIRKFWPTIDRMIA